MNCGSASVLALAALAMSAATAAGEDNDRRPAKGIQDNSFLIEEAYNQGRDEVQHITTLQRQGRNWFFGFSQEWPLFSELHQISYSVPYSWLRAEGGRSQGIGDIQVNYRYQALKETDRTPAFAPRASLVVPSGNRAKGLGENSLGYDVNLPFSKIVADRVTLHANAGMLSFFDVDGLQPTSYSLGGSVVYALTRDTNVLLEVLHDWNETVAPGRLLEREKTLTVLPGIRQAFNFQDAQLVMGVGAPVSFTGSQREYGIFMYLSLEHKFLR